MRLAKFAILAFLLSLGGLSPTEASAILIYPNAQGTVDSGFETVFRWDDPEFNPAHHAYEIVIDDNSDFLTPVVSRLISHDWVGGVSPNDAYGVTERFDDLTALTNPSNSLHWTSVNLEPGDVVQANAPTGLPEPTYEDALTLTTNLGGDDAFYFDVKERFEDMNQTWVTERLRERGSLEFWFRLNQPFDPSVNQSIITLRSENASGDVTQLALSTDRTLGLRLHRMTAFAPGHGMDYWLPAEDFAGQVCSIDPRALPYAWSPGPALPTLGEVTNYFHEHWHHVTLAWDMASAERGQFLYIDGILVAKLLQDFPFYDLSAGGTMRLYLGPVLGFSGSGEAFSIDDLRLSYVPRRAPSALPDWQLPWSNGAQVQFAAKLPNTGAHNYYWRIRRQEYWTGASTPWVSSTYPFKRDAPLHVGVNLAPQEHFQGFGGQVIVPSNPPTQLELAQVFLPRLHETEPDSSRTNVLLEWWEPTNENLIEDDASLNLALFDFNTNPMMGILKNQIATLVSMDSTITITGLGPRQRTIYQPGEDPPDDPVSPNGWLGYDVPATGCSGTFTSAPNANFSDEPDDLLPYTAALEYAESFAALFTYLLEQPQYFSHKYQFEPFGEPNLAYCGFPAETTLYERYLNYDLVMKAIQFKFNTLTLSSGQPLRNFVTIMGPETTHTTEGREWFKWTVNGLDHVIDVYSVSAYINGDGTATAFRDYALEYRNYIDSCAGNCDSDHEDLIFSEFAGTLEPLSSANEGYDYGTYLADSMVNALNGGISGGNHWLLHDWPYDGVATMNYWGFWWYRDHNWALKPGYFAWGALTSSMRNSWQPPYVPPGAVTPISETSLFALQTYSLAPADVDIAAIANVGVPCDFNSTVWPLTLIVMAKKSPFIASETSVPLTVQLSSLYTGKTFRRMSYNVEDVNDKLNLQDYTMLDDSTVVTVGDFGILSDAIQVDSFTIYKQICLFESGPTEPGTTSPPPGGITPGG